MAADVPVEVIARIHARISYFVEVAQGQTALGGVAGFGARKIFHGFRGEDEGQEKCHYQEDGAEGAEDQANRRGSVHLGERVLTESVCADWKWHSEIVTKGYLRSANSKAI